MTFSLRPEQQVAIEWMRKREDDVDHTGGILADDVGKGKTFVVAGLLRQAPKWPVLIAVPKSALSDWVRVLLSVPDQRSLWVVDGDAPESAYMESDKYDLVLTSHSCFSRSKKGSKTDRLATIVERGWGRVIVDEAHVIKNPDTIIHKTLRDIPASARWALTATPVQNSRKDLLSLARFLHVSSNDVDFVRDTFVLMRANTTSELTPLVVTNVMMTLEHDEEKSLYDKTSSDLTAGGSDVELTDIDAHDAKLLNTSTAKNMELILRCMQACTHPALYWRSMSQRSSATDEEVLEATRSAEAAATARSTKLEYIADDIEMTESTEKSIVFCNFLGEMNILSGYLIERGIRYRMFEGSMDTFARKDAVDEFRDDDEIRVFICQIQCGGSSLNLQCASRIYFVRPQWNPAVEAQAIGRSHRSGQKSSVTVMRLVAKDTIDEAILKRCGDKLVAVTETLKDSSLQDRLTGQAFPYLTRT